MSARTALLAMTILVCSVPALADESAHPPDTNYQLVFHTRLSGQTEDVAVSVSEGNFSLRTPDPDIAVSGALEVTEGLMHRLSYEFRHRLDGPTGDNAKDGRYYERSGRVILEPGKPVNVLDAPGVRLDIELKKGR